MLLLRRQNAGRLFLHRVEFGLESGKRFQKARVMSVVDGDDRFGRVRLEGMLCSFSGRGLGGALRLFPHLLPLCIVRGLSCARLCNTMCVASHVDLARAGPTCVTFTFSVSSRCWAQAKISWGTPCSGQRPTLSSSRGTSAYVLQTFFLSRTIAR